MKTILLNGPGFDPEAATSGGMGGYVRNIQVYLSEFASDRYELVHAPTTVRKKGDGWLRKVPRLGQDLSSVRRRLPGACGVHMMALYRSALPREVAIAAMLKARGVPYVYEIKAGAFIRFVEGSSAPVRKATEWLVRNAGEVLCEGEDYVRWLHDEWGIRGTWFPNFVPDHEVPEDVPERFQDEEISALSARGNEKRISERIAGRVAAKRAIVALSGASPEQVQIENLPSGAPIAKVAGLPGPQLSISHSHGHAVAMVRESGPLGIDLEAIESRSPAFVSEWFSEKESALVGNDPRLQTLAWSAKEAVLKALGQGMALNPREIQLVAIDGESLHVELFGDVAQAHTRIGGGKLDLRWRLFEGMLLVNAQLAA